MARRSFRMRGVVEGFYGTPWSHDAGLDLLSFLGARDMNAYVYAPKDDAKHRAKWREQYDDAEQERFRELAGHAAFEGIRFGFAISPGLDIDYESSDDRAMLLDKLEPIRDCGVSWFLLLVDDIPMQPGLAPRQADLAAFLLDALPNSMLTLCPTEYVGTQSSDYLAELGKQLPADVDVMWTGPTVCSPTITAADARAFSDALGGRPPLVWDNYPVNDGTMSHSLHLGPYQGRDPNLAEVLTGVLCNPMTQPYASKVALATAAAFLRDPDGYDRDGAWTRAIDDVGEERKEAFGVLARVCDTGPLAEPASQSLARRVDALEAALATPQWSDELEPLLAELRAARGLHEIFAPEGDGDGDDLAAEVAPWAAAARTEAEAGIAALKLLRTVLAADRENAAEVERAMHSAFLMLYSWDGARTNRNVVFGPRFALYPAVVQLADGTQGLDARLAVREDGNAIDRLCRLALDTYDRWQEIR